ncbi:phenylacetone monooxygenase [Anopheles sinensis]|uniref:Phenylacetone monooxygenase n=1 Tax=Anopheles sinensis TaxID=74873 RepID=A0A084VK85_ANOSI|nr:phenylacetone monooxygenase [Anopheles sinensis]
MASTLQVKSVVPPFHQRSVSPAPDRRVFWPGKARWKIDKYRTSVLCRPTGPSRATKLKRPFIVPCIDPSVRHLASEAEAAAEASLLDNFRPLQNRCFPFPLPAVTAYSPAAYRTETEEPFPCFVNS